jgi:hypothetical protein
MNETQFRYVKILGIPYEHIADFCRARHIRRLAIFGSVLSEDFGPESDLDVLVEFDENHVPGLAFFEMQDELSKIMRRKVDLNTPGFHSRHSRQQVPDEALLCYAEA